MANYTDSYEAFIGSKKDSIRNFESVQKRLNKLFAEALKKGDETEMKAIEDNIRKNAAEHKKIIESTAKENDGFVSSLLNEMYSIAPQLAGRSADDILSDPSAVSDVYKYFDDNAQFAWEHYNQYLTYIFKENKKKFKDRVSALKKLTSFGDTLTLPEDIDFDEMEIKRKKAAYKSNFARLALNEQTASSPDKLISVLTEGMAADSKMADFYRSKGYEEGSEEITGLQKAYRDKQSKIITAQNMLFDERIDTINSRIDERDFEKAMQDPENYSDTVNIIGEQIDLAKDKIFAYEQEIKRLDSLYENDVNNQAYIDRVRKLKEEMQNSTLAVQNYYTEMNAAAQNSLSDLKTTEDTVISMLKDKYSAIKDNYKKRISLEKEYVDNRKDLLKKLLESYERKWRAEDADSARQDTLKSRSKLVSERNALSAAAAGGDLEALSRAEDITEKITGIDKELETNSKESFRNSVRSRIADEIASLDDLSSKYSLDLNNFNDLIDEKLKRENLYAEAHNAIETGIFQTAAGNYASLSEAYREFINRTGEGYSYIGEEIQSNFTNKIIEAKKALEELPRLLSASSELRVREYLENSGYSVDWDNSTKEVIVNGKHISDKNFSRSSDGRLIATSDQINALLDKFGLANTSATPYGKIYPDAKTALSYKEENTLTPLADTLTEDKIKQILSISAKDFFSEIQSGLSPQFKFSSDNSAISSKQYIPSANIDNSVTINGNVDSVTFPQLKAALKEQEKIMGNIVSSGFVKTLSTFGTFGK